MFFKIYYKSVKKLVAKKKVFLVNSWVSTETDLWISAGTMATDIQARVSEVHLALYPVSDQGQGRMLRKHFNNSAYKD